MQISHEIMDGVESVLTGVWLPRVGTGVDSVNGKWRLEPAITRYPVD
jgi:hypothetical protein